jgi:hypothetical protein
VQGAAEPDTVVITAATQRLVGGLFVVEEPGPQMLKGVREPVTLYRVVQPSGVRSEALFGQSLEIARRQEPKTFDLHAATSLARLRQRQGKRAAARALRDAKALLDDLA